jgi:hypothetical protein
MPLPPLAAPERRLARFAAVSSWATALFGLLCGVWPRAAFRLFSLGAVATSSAGMRLFGALAGAALLGVALSCRRTALRPREERGGLHALLALLGAGALFALSALLRARGPGQPADAQLPLAVAAGLFGLLFVTALWLFVRGAPGVNVGAVPQAPEAEAPANRPVALGVRPAPAAQPLPAEVQQAAGGSRG